MIRALLADDQDLVRAGLRALLGNEPKITVVAEAATGDDAIAMTRKHHPDVVLMDIRMPGTKGIEATRRIRADPALSATRVLILTTFDDDDDILEAIRLGAAGYLLKDTPSDDLRAAVRTIASGGQLAFTEHRQTGDGTCRRHAIARRAQSHASTGSPTGNLLCCAVSPVVRATPRSQEFFTSVPLPPEPTSAESSPSSRRATAQNSQSLPTAPVLTVKNTTSHSSSPATTQYPPEEERGGSLPR